jgi:cytochrome P450
MVLYPDVQAQAQAEIDNVIGNDKLPTVDDRERLPFVSALAMEALRWHIVTPTGVPHRVMEDDIHDGYLIPEGALIITNIWYIYIPYSLVIHQSDLNPYQEHGPRL